MLVLSLIALAIAVYVAIGNYLFAPKYAALAYDKKHDTHKHYYRQTAIKDGYFKGVFWLPLSIGWLMGFGRLTEDKMLEKSVTHQKELLRIAELQMRNTQMDIIRKEFELGLRMKSSGDYTCAIDGCDGYRDQGMRFCRSCTFGYETRAKEIARA